MKGLIQNKEIFLKNVSQALGRTRLERAVQKPSWNLQPQWDVLNGLNADELMMVLKDQCELIHTDFLCVSLSELPEALEQTIDKYDGKTIVTSDDDRFEKMGLNEKFNQLRKEEVEIHEWDATLGQENIDIAERADIGITISDMALAESGTVVLFSSAGKARTVSLLPASYIAIIPKSTIVPRLTQSAKDIHQKVEAGEHVPSCINFISGPSNSADIEMNLVVGVHGPIRTTYIVVDNL
ncbi:LutC/YkgG family protein [Falsibacillus albus]|uniref:Lactate utilization protein C n=1 Tax=Falsibacillus albus TaxID=2478915 RepID=A0A3L7JX48_9BACI|nr:lactate utilization protein C [Falsibacillus albus]RLQ94231.1 lactate utilization protein C [Falsibacillus albus]